MKTEIIDVNADILGGTPIFMGTRVPVESLFDHLESGISIDDFLSDFPTVDRKQVVQVLEMVGELFTFAYINVFMKLLLDENIPVCKSFQEQMERIF